MSAAAVRVLLLLAVVVPVAVARPDLLTASVRSPRAWLAVGLIAGAAVLTRLLVARVLHRPGAAPWVGTAVVLGALALLIGPSLRETTINEAFPPVADGPSNPRSTSPAPSSAEPSPPPSAGPASAATATAMATRLSSGPLKGIDHRASGVVALYRVGGRVVVRFEGVDIQGTPKTSVRLVPRGDRTPAAGRRVGDLKAERGSFSYVLPADVDGSRAWTVLVWCDPFNTPVAAADLTEPP